MDGDMIGRVTGNWIEGRTFVPEAPSDIEVLVLGPYDIKVTVPFVQETWDLMFYKDGVPFGPVSNSNSYVFSGLTPATSYNFYVRGRNADEELGPASVTKQGTTKTVNSKLGTIQEAMVALINAMATSGGYWFTWGACNEVDHAKKTAYPNAEIYIGDEQNTDGIDAAHATAYSNKITFNIHTWCKLLTVTDNPDFAIEELMDKALEDLKRLFGINNTVSGTCHLVQYRSFTKDLLKRGDIILAGRIVSVWDIYYIQDRLNPTQNGY